MGKNKGNSWLNAVKRAFLSPSKDDEKRSSRRREENEQEKEDDHKRGKRRWIFGKHFPLETTIQHNVAKLVNSPTVRYPTTTSTGEENLAAKQPKMETSVEIIKLIRPSLLVKEHKAAVVIQTTFRGYLARRALLALKGVVKLQALIRGYNVRKRAKTTLKCIQSLVRVQTQVCDQRRRLSCEATGLGSMFSQANSNSRKSTTSREAINTSHNVGSHPRTLEEIQALIQKAKECSLKQRTLAHALSQQTWSPDEDNFSDNNYEDRKMIHPCVRKDRNLCNYQRDLHHHPIKTVEIDTSTPYSFTSPKTPHKSQYQNHDNLHSYSPVPKKHLNPSAQSPKTPSSPRTQVDFCSPFYETEERKYYQTASNTPTSRPSHSSRLSMSENSCHLSRPSYMAPTKSAIARVRSNSTPRQRALSPSRDSIDSAKKRLSFPVPDNADGKLNIQECKGMSGGQFGEGVRSSVRYYCTD